MAHKVIVIGSDEALVKSRAMVLRARDYQTTWGLEGDAPGLLQRGTYELLLVCSSVPTKNASELIGQAKRRDPKMCIVRLINPPASSLDTDLADAVIETDYHPQTWIATVERLLRVSDQAEALP